MHHPAARGRCAVCQAGNRGCCEAAAAQRAGPALLRSRKTEYARMGLSDLGTRQGRAHFKQGYKKRGS